ncbi:hypothetical protein LZ31DRAFT_259511 [Colletotrichum somersetense]|nr:hypothetical protein LZ31DRAFT_259511 [Colletotrichum somersetense]
MPPSGSSALASCSRISRSQPCYRPYPSTLPRYLSEILPTPGWFDPSPPSLLFGCSTRHGMTGTDSHYLVFPPRRRPSTFGPRCDTITSKISGMHDANTSASAARAPAHLQRGSIPCIPSSTLHRDRCHTFQSRRHFTKRNTAVCTLV